MQRSNGNPAAIPEIHGKATAGKQSAAYQRSAVDFVNDRGARPSKPPNYCAVNLHSLTAMRQVHRPLALVRQTKFPNQRIRQGQHTCEPGIDNGIHHPEVRADAGYGDCNVRLPEDNRACPSD